MRDYTQEHIAKNPTMKLQEKFNLNLNLNADFHLPVGSGWQADPRIQGQYCYYRAKLPSEFNYFYAPTNPFDSYLHVKRGGKPTLIPVVYNTFYDMNFFDGLVIASNFNTIGETYHYQFYLSNIQQINVYDVYENTKFTVGAGLNVAMITPFPTYNMKLLAYVPNNPTSFDLTIEISPYNFQLVHYMVENTLAIVGAPTNINNYYELNDAGGTEVVTNPNLALPSFATEINITNNDGGVDMDNVYLKLISYLKIGGF